MEFKIGNKIIIKPNIHRWRQPYGGRIGIIIGIGLSFDWCVDFKDNLLKCSWWYNEDMELYAKPGKQLLFDFMKE